MNSRIMIAASLLAGVAIGAAAVDTLRAQSKGPVYVMTDFAEVSDLPALLAAGKGLPASIQAAGGKVVARSDDVTALDGTAPKRFAIFWFPDLDKAKAWHGSDAMKEPLAGRAKHSKSRSFVVDALAN